MNPVPQAQQASYLPVVFLWISQRMEWRSERISQMDRVFYFDYTSLHMDCRPVDAAGI